jgi:3-dehydroquinate synthase
VIRVGGGNPGEPAGAGRYDVVVGRGAAVVGESLTGLVDGARRVMVLYAAAVAPTTAAVLEVLRVNGFEVHSHQLPDAESAKTVEVLSECWSLLGQASFTRTDAVVAVGGGAVTDVAGFVAATWLRGVRVVHVPTTLLGMVDAAVGGKTGINTAEGKNLVGAFHPPAGVLCDVDVLATLPRGDLVAGMAEVVKAGFIADPAILDLLRADPAAALDVARPVLVELVERSVAVKARVVTEDLTESSLREILNYGHTMAHAIEQVEGYTWRHGDAVAVGMLFAAELGRLAGRTPTPLAARHREVIAALGLPTAYPAAAEPDHWQRLLVAMGRDKKSRGTTLRFVVLDDLARPGRLVGPDPELLLAARSAVTG